MTLIEQPVSRADALGHVDVGIVDTLYGLPRTVLALPGGEGAHGHVDG